MIQLHFEFLVGLQEVLNHGDRIGNALKIAKGQLALLQALLSKNDRCCTLDDATEDLSIKFSDDGKWRGHVTLGLFSDGLIDRVGAENSKRPSRNRGLLRLWILLDESKARKRIESLQRLITERENPRSAATENGQDGSTITETTGKESRL
jgi:hypothetical protein